MDFYLARHGEAVADLIDPSRPLSPAGRQAVERVALQAVEKAVQVSLIYHSGILRAEQTAEIFARHLAPGGGLGVMTGLRPDDDPDIAAAELATEAVSIMLVGHLPHLNRLASVLLRGDGGSDVIEFLPGMLARFSREGSLWNLNWTIAP
jgi:phosphohistidine phosphatase